jgi:hypothetical protein
MANTAVPSARMPIKTFCMAHLSFSPLVHPHTEENLTNGYWKNAQLF